MRAITLRKGYSTWGADSGRPTLLPLDKRIKVRLRLVLMPLDSGGYDSGGAYWGLREGWLVMGAPMRVRVQRDKRLYWAESVESVDLDNFCRPTTGKIEMCVEACNRAAAKQIIRNILPNARFYR